MRELNPDEKALIVADIHDALGNLLPNVGVKFTHEQMPFVNLFASRVEVGAQWLDRILPEWWRTVLTASGNDSFDMKQGTNCVLGWVGRDIIKQINGQLEELGQEPVDPTVYSNNAYDAVKYRLLDRIPGGLDSLFGFYVPEEDKVETVYHNPNELHEDWQIQEEAQTFAYGVLGDLWVGEASVRRFLLHDEAEAERVRVDRLNEIENRRRELVTEIEELDEEEADLTEVNDD